MAAWIEPLARIGELRAALVDVLLTVNHDHE
jgi:hypothetical protein